MKVYLTGEVEDTGLSIISLPAVIENKTDHAICVSYQGTGNGWTISRSVFGNSGSNVAKNAKAKTFLWILASKAINSANAPVQTGQPTDRPIDGNAGGPSSGSDDALFFKTKDPFS